jgi:transcriptional repressor NrdR
VIDSRVTDSNRAIRRRRTCDDCDYRFTTFERARATELMVIKRDGTRESFDRDKLKAGIWRACVKRRISEAEIDRMVNDLEEDLAKGGEISSADIGKAVMAKLKVTDPVAYVRFASVYQAFDTPESFQEILKTL